MLPGRLGLRFALEALFLVAVAIGAGLADLRPLVIVLVMLGAWLLVALIELTAARIAASPVSYLLPPPVEAPEGEPAVSWSVPEERTIVAPPEPGAEPVGEFDVPVEAAPEAERVEPPAAAVEAAPQPEAPQPEPVLEPASAVPDADDSPAPVGEAVTEPEPELAPDAVSEDERLAEPLVPAAVADATPEPEPEPMLEQAPAAEVEHAAEEATGELQPALDSPEQPRRPFLGLLRRREAEAEAEPEPEPEPAHESEPEPEAAPQVAFEPLEEAPRRRIRVLPRRRDPEAEPEPAADVHEPGPAAVYEPEADVREPEPAGREPEAVQERELEAEPGAPEEASRRRIRILPRRREQGPKPPGDLEPECDAEPEAPAEPEPSAQEADEPLEERPRRGVRALLRRRQAEPESPPVMPPRHVKLLPPRPAEQVDRASEEVAELFGNGGARKHEDESGRA